MSTSRRMLLINNDDDMAKKDIIIKITQSSYSTPSFTIATTLDDLATQMGTTKSDLITKGKSVRTSTSINDNWNFFKNFNFYIYVMDSTNGYDGVYPVGGIKFNWDDDISGSETKMTFLTCLYDSDRLCATYNLI